MNTSRDVPGILERIDRIEEWRLVEQRLSAAVDHVPGDAMPLLKDFFFSGERPRELDEVLPNAVMREYCLLWLHPDELASGVLFPTARIGVLSGNFSALMWSLRAGAFESMGSTYGVMGGREQTIFLKINCGLDHLGTVANDPERGRSACTTPYSVFVTLMEAVEKETRCHERRPADPSFESGYLAHAPGLVLWDHLSSAMDTYGDEIYLKCPGTDRRIDWSKPRFKKTVEGFKAPLDERFDLVLRGLLQFFDESSKNSARDRPHTRAYVRSVVERYERRDFSDPLLSRWDAARSAV